MRYISESRISKLFAGFCLILSMSGSVFAQTGLIPTTEALPEVPAWRRPVVYGGMVFVGSAAYAGLYSLWYADYPQSGFHFFDDNRQWGGMDKAGHFTTSYLLGYLGKYSLDWAGEKPCVSRWVGGSLGLMFMTGIEIMDGFSSQWGFSWGDMAANMGGSGFFILQDVLWKEQRILPKFSFFPSEYAEKRPDLLGSNWTQQWLKDYNGQRYWLSANIWSFLPERENRKFPKWLNVSVGYSIQGYLGAVENPPPFEHITRSNHWYLSVDVDLRKIPVKSKFLKVLFTGIGFIKIPAPTLEFNNREGFHMKFHPLFF